jgi:farnesyl diphosphate synthase
MVGLNERMTEVADLVTETLDRLLPAVPGPRGEVVEAMRYACLGGGKRLRPFLLISSADLYDVPRSQSARAAAALEMIHCYSLVHDDLPAMDDADTRRGRPSAHKAFHEATAILAGDGLLTHAFGVLASPETAEDPAIRARLIAGLADAAGADGMVGGQMIDIAAEREGTDFDLEGISELQSLKTGALIRYACEAGAVMGGADADGEKALAQYADDLGLAFQIVDDLLDVTGTEEQLGKPAGQDQAMGKATFVGLLGIEGAQEKAQSLVDRASASLSPFGNAATPLADVAQFVLKRTS